MARLTPEQFKALVKWKGWSYRELAERWGITSVWMSNVARNAERPAHYDDALVGLPNKRTMTRDVRNLERRLRALVDAKAHDAAAKAPGHAGRRPSGEYRYHGYFMVGAIVTASEEIGIVAEEGARGAVFQVVDTGKGERYGVLFETGLWDWFDPASIDRMLVMTGLTDPEMAQYRYRDEPTLQTLFASGKLQFWPELG